MKMPSLPKTFETQQHPFVGLLLEHNSGYIDQRIASMKKEMGGEPLEPIILPSHQFYTSEVMEAVAPILSTLERIRWSQTFLNGFPNAKGYRKKGISRDGWMDYHYSYFAVSYATIRDLTLLLTNEVFRLKVPARLCTMDAIVNNGWVKSTEVFQLLKDVAAQASKHQEARNRHVHRGKLPDIGAVLEDDLYRSLSIIDFLDMLDVKWLTPDQRAFVNKGFRDIVTKLRGRIAEETIALDNLLAKLFTGLESHYRRKYEELTPVKFTDLGRRSKIERAQTRLNKDARRR